MFSGRRRQWNDFNGCKGGRITKILLLISEGLNGRLHEGDLVGQWLRSGLTSETAFWFLLRLPSLHGTYDTSCRYAPRV